MSNNKYIQLCYDERIVIENRLKNGESYYCHCQVAWTLNQYYLSVRLIALLRSKYKDSVAQAIDRADSDFRYAATNILTFDQPLTETISYQVTHNNSLALSIIVNIKQDMHGAHPISLTHFWTFDKKSGEVISLNDLTEQSEKAAGEIVAAARNNIKETIKQRQQTELDLSETITQETLSNFVIIDGGNSLAWPIGQASLLPSAYGEMTIKVPIAAVAKYLQNPTARKLANIPKPPEPKPKPAPAAPTVADSGSKVIALTFDDGPGPYTAQLLDILDQHGAKATFFLIGSKVSARADVLRRIHARSHPGAIILMHDIHQTSVNAVPCILSALKQQGYSFVTVQGLLGNMAAGAGYP